MLLRVRLLLHLGVCCPALRLLVSPLVRSTLLRSVWSVVFVCGISLSLSDTPNVWRVHWMQAWMRCVEWFFLLVNLGAGGLFV